MSFFEDHLEEIERAIAAKRRLWSLSSLSYLSYDDVSQQVRLHIAKKLEENKWDSSRPFGPWVSRTITNQIKNIIRNHYRKYVPPCMDCPFNNDGVFCAFTASRRKDSTCPSYKKWLKNKKLAYELKLASPIEEYDGVSHYTDFDVVTTTEKFHKLMQERLPARMREAYVYLYIERWTDLQVVKKMGFTNSKVKGKVSGLRQLNNIKSKIWAIAQELAQEIDLDY